jgi:hypothetical protein
MASASALCGPPAVLISHFGGKRLTASRTARTHGKPVRSVPVRAFSWTAQAKMRTAGGPQTARESCTRDCRLAMLRPLRHRRRGIAALPSVCPLQKCVADNFPRPFPLGGRKRRRLRTTRRAKHQSSTVVVAVVVFRISARNLPLGLFAAQPRGWLPVVSRPRRTTAGLRRDGFADRCLVEA